MIENYKKLRFRLTKIPAGEKGPTHDGWNREPTPYKQFTNGHNIGLLHSLSRTCCFDIDDLDTATKIPGLKELIEKGVRYTSGKQNRVKSIFRIPKKYDIDKFKTWKLEYKGKNVGQFRCGSKDGTSLQDVLPPSKHPEGTRYEWIDQLPLKHKEIPALPKSVIKHILSMDTVRKGNEKRYQSKHLAFYVKVYNDWFHKSNKSLHSELMSLGSYEDMGMGRYRRLGSTNKLNVIVSEDEHGWYGYNFSDTQGDKLLPEGAFDPYEILVLKKGGETSARRYVTSENKETTALCDKLSGPKATINVEAKEDETVTLIRLEGIKYDEARGFPYLALSTMFPGEDTGEHDSLRWNKDKKDRKRENNFARIVKSVLYQQEGVYNPDMAFWYSLILVDYLAGCGYESVNSSRTAPLYVFTAGDSSDGKSATIQSGEKHLLDVGGKGNISDEDARWSVDDEDAKGMNPIFSASFNNKKVIKNVGSAQGVEDIITVGMDHGCDILFTQDEYGLRDNGTIDSAGKAMRSLLLSYRTLSRFEAVEPRALAQTGNTNKKKKGNERHETYCVHFNYFTAATNETLKGVIKDSEVGMGYTQRFIGGVSRSEYFDARRSKLGNNVSEVPVDAYVKNLLKSITDNSNKVLGYERCESGVPVRIDNDAEEYLGELSTLCITSDDVKMKKMVENVQPVARVRAIAEDPRKPRITMEIVKWAHTICSCGILYFEWLQGILKGMDERVPLGTQAERKVMMIMAEHYNSPETAKPRAEIVRRCNFGRLGINAGIYGPVWEMMVKMGVITTIKGKTAAGRKAYKYYLKDVEGSDGD